MGRKKDLPVGNRTHVHAQAVKDSGKRQEFSTGARRDTQDDKPRFELITPYALERIAWIYTLGAKKYGESNWQKGMPYSRYLSSTFRHIFAWMRGEREEDHIAMACWNLMAIMHHEAVGPDEGEDGVPLDDIRRLYYPDAQEEWEEYNG